MPFTRIGVTSHAQLTAIGATDHHAAGLADHNVAEHDDTLATGAELDTLTDASNADALHVHVDNPPQAIQSALEAETNQNTYAPPDLARHLPGMAKGWVRITDAGLIESPSNNIASITDTGTGSRIIVVDDDFTTDVWIVVGMITAGITNFLERTNAQSFTVGGVTILVGGGDATPYAAKDKSTAHVLYGAQV